VLVTGSGNPVTVVAHGFGATIPESRALASGIPGTKVFPQARGHGEAPLPEQPGYGELAADLIAVADAHDATQAFGTSMGAHTILRLLATQPTRFTRLVLLLPAAIDTPVRRGSVLPAALASQDRETTLSVVQAQLLPLTGERVEAYARARADFLLASPGLPVLLEALPDDLPVPDRAVLGAVSADVLVIGQEGDPVHPAAVARELAAALPKARLVVFEEPGAAFRERARLRDLISSHLTLS
jgi:3-oxoadipate enol-lactonase